MVSHHHKFIFIHVPKTGGGSIERLLKHSCIFHHRHQKLHDIHAKYPESVDYYTFAFVRNPWDRLVSNFKFKQYNHRDKKSRPEEWAAMSFRDFILNTNGIGMQCTLSNKTQYDFLTEGGVSLSSYCIYKYENMEENYGIVCNRIGIRRDTLPHVNRTRHKHYTEYYDDETRDIVAKKYAKDIEHFGYKFEG